METQSIITYAAAMFLSGAVGFYIGAFIINRSWERVINQIESDFTNFIKTGNLDSKP